MTDELLPFLEQAKDFYELKELERLGLTPELDQRDLIIEYLAFVLMKEKDIDIITPEEKENLFIRAFCDSIQPLLLFGYKKNAMVLDVHAKGGFPAIPTMIFRPDLKFTIIEDDSKRLAYLKELKSTLKISNLTIYNGFDTVKRKKYEYDYIISRNLGTLAEFGNKVKNFVKEDGKIYTFKTDGFHEELSDITMNKEKYGVGISEIAEYDLAGKIFGLHLISLEKI